MSEKIRTLKTHNIVFLVIAAAAPLTVVSAGVTAAYATSAMPGVPLGYLLCGALVAFFSVGFCAMAKEIPNTAAFFSYVSAGLGKSHGLAASSLAIVSYTAMQIALYCLLGYTASSLFELGLPAKLSGYDESFPSAIVFSWMSNAGGFGLVFLLLTTSVSVYFYFRKHKGLYPVFVTKVAPTIAIIGFGTMFVLILANFENLIGDAELWYLVFVIPTIILLCGVAGFVRGELLKRSHPHIYSNIGSGHPPGESRVQSRATAEPKNSQLVTSAQD